MSEVWERLIRSVKKAIKVVLGNPGVLVGLETLRTVFAEVTSILNSHPICPSSDDPNALESRSLQTIFFYTAETSSYHLESSLKKI